MESAVESCKFHFGQMDGARCGVQPSRHRKPCGSWGKSPELYIAAPPNLELALAECTCVPREAGEIGAIGSARGSTRARDNTATQMPERSPGPRPPAGVRFARVGSNPP